VSGGFALIGGRAVPNGPPAYFPPIDSSTPNLDPISKIQRDEALSYINQYVLPSISTNSQLEKALNANALGAEILGSNDSQTWGSWGTAAGANHTTDGMEAAIERRENPYGLRRDTSILATGLQNMTAHFTLGQENGRTQPLGNVALLSLEDSEKALQSAKKETEKLEKSLNQLLKKNRRLLFGAGH
jgi:CCR4-NOT transcription complex subunit 4